jgi:hypothetical protein
MAGKGNIQLNMGSEHSQNFDFSGGQRKKGLHEIPQHISPI